jgi:glycosyltransferase involved in cell wall biosynthesis
MKVGILFHKNPLAEPSGIDLIRLRAIAGGLICRGISAEVLAPVDQERILDGSIPVFPLHHLMKGRYDIIKTCYHFSIELIQDYTGPVVSRIVRVVDDCLPERDEQWRERLIRCQQQICRRSSVLVLNNTENQRRWQHFYGHSLPIVLVPTGCPQHIPKPRKNPFDANKRNILFLGGIAAPRMIALMNTMADRLEHMAQIHIIGLNKVHWYGMADEGALHPSIIQHGEICEEDTWDYLFHADIGLALATGSHVFDNDLSKIYNYLRGGLPVLSESPVLNNDLIRQTGLGRIFQFGNVEDLIAASVSLLENPPTLETRNAAMNFMSTDHAWERRIDIYEKLFNELITEQVPELQNP